MAKKFDAYFPTYKEVELTAGANLSGGDFATAGVIHGFTIVDVLSGAKCALITECEKVKAEKATGAIAEGAAVYWDSSEGNVTGTATDNTLIGYAIEAALSADTHVWMSFDGALAFAKA